MGESTTATTGTLADSSTTAACGDATEVPAIPEGWEGPVSVRAHDIGDRIACPDDREEVRRAWVTGAPTSCECACTGDPAQLCALVIDTSTSCNGAEIPTASTCVPSGTSFVQVGIAPSECTPEATLRIPDGATELLACALADDPCVDVPDETMGPCVIGTGACPEGFPTAIDTDEVACAACGACDTSTYCASVTASTWTESGCAGESTPLQLDVCNLTQTDASVSYESPLPAAPCGEVDGVATALRFCCA